MSLPIWPMTLTLHFFLHFPRHILTTTTSLSPSQQSQESQRCTSMRSTLLRFSGPQWWNQANFCARCDNIFYKTNLVIYEASLVAFVNKHEVTVFDLFTHNILSQSKRGFETSVRTYININDNLLSLHCGRFYVYQMVTSPWW